MRQQAFSLIELMIVVAIIGVLSAVAIPTYGKYTLKSKTSELIDYANNLGFRVSQYISEKNPTSLTGACTNIKGIVFPKTNITNGWIVGPDCLVIVSSQNIYPNSTALIITLTPALSSSDGYLSWTCNSYYNGSITSGSIYAPNNCQ